MAISSKLQGMGYVDMHGPLLEPPQQSNSQPVENVPNPEAASHWVPMFWRNILQLSSEVTEAVCSVKTLVSASNKTTTQCHNTEDKIWTFFTAKTSNQNHLRHNCLVMTKSSSWAEKQNFNIRYTKHNIIQTRSLSNPKMKHLHVRY